MKKVYLIGHGNADADVFLDELTRNNIKTLIDVRSIPFSEYASHFNQEPLKLLLSENGIKYKHLGKELGGRTKGFEDYVKNKRLQSFEGFGSKVCLVQKIYENRGVQGSYGTS